MAVVGRVRVTHSKEGGLLTLIFNFSIASADVELHETENETENAIFVYNK